MQILLHDETETGPRVRKTLIDKNGIEPTLVGENLAVSEDGDGIMTRDWTIPDIDLYTYVRPSNGQRVWLIEAKLFFPPDIELFRGYVVDEEPTAAQVRHIVAKDLQKGAIL